MRAKRMILLCFGLSGCMATTQLATMSRPLTDQEMAFAKSAVSRTMRDPASVQFRDLNTYVLSVTGDRILCGELNARNGFGGYSGYAPFYIRFQNDQIKRMHLDDTTGYGVALLACTEAADGTLPISDRELASAG